ncbi:MAG: 50S ribosomal protein L18 [Planctomycetales bacterium 4484_123]|nr:MAG: 50S ribosomal protein L18 [Planctomycetales bacterium 4484_123]
MANRVSERIVRRHRRKRRVRRRVVGTEQRPRLTVFRSHKNIYAQIIDDTAGRTLAAASSMDRELRPAVPYGGNRAAAVVVGQKLAERALRAGIRKVVFDRNGYVFHGRIKELAEAARRAGLEF